MYSKSHNSDLNFDLIIPLLDHTIFCQTFACKAPCVPLHWDFIHLFRVVRWPCMPSPITMIWIFTGLCPFLEFHTYSRSPDTLYAKSNKSDLNFVGIFPFLDLEFWLNLCVQCLLSDCVYCRFETSHTYLDLIMPLLELVILLYCRVKTSNKQVCEQFNLSCHYRVHWPYKGIA